MATPTLPQYAQFCAAVLAENYNGYLLPQYREQIEFFKAATALGSPIDMQNTYLLFLDELDSSSLYIPAGATSVLFVSGNLLVTPINAALPATASFNNSNVNIDINLAVGQQSQQVQSSIADPLNPANLVLTNCVLTYNKIVIAFTGV